MSAIKPVDGDLASATLVDRLVALGSTRTASHNLISRAAKFGLLFRNGLPGQYVYRVNPGYVPAPRKRHGGNVLQQKAEHQIRPPHNEFTIVPTPVAYTGPAFDQEPLTPHLGAPICDHDELTPAEGMRYCDATRRIFRHAFTE